VVALAAVMAAEERRRSGGGDGSVAGAATAVATTDGDGGHRVWRPCMVHVAKHASTTRTACTWTARHV
jgi:hypothetical protein